MPLPSDPNVEGKVVGKRGSLSPGSGQETFVKLEDGHRGPAGQAPPHGGGGLLAFKHFYSSTGNYTKRGNGLKACVRLL